MRRLRVFIVALIVSAVTVPTAMATTVLASFLLLPLPATPPPIKSGIESQISHVYDINGNELGVFREFEQSVPVARADMPSILKQAVVASEDRNFYHHQGVDLRGTLRALVADLRGQKLEQGGSTITQQYVKNSVKGVGSQKTVLRKLREAVLASELERSHEFSKDEILFRYLSSIFLGEGAYGVGAASETYFRHPAPKVTLSEAALLSGIIPAPSVYDPRVNPSGADARRITVLDEMLRQGVINQAQHDDAVNQHVWLTVRGKPPGPATLVYPPTQVQTKYPYFLDYVHRYLVARYGADVVDRGGLRIQTTLDQNLQAAAEKSVADSLKGTSDPLEMSLVSIEPPTGFVKALVGGRDFYSATYSGAQVNLALAACPAHPAASVKVEVPPTCWDDPNATVGGGGLGRQTGSSFKAFTLATAFSKGFPPTKVYSAPTAYTQPSCVGADCTIHNAEGEGGGSRTIQQATAQSVNTVYAQIARDVGVKNIAQMAKDLGVTTAWYAPRIHGSPGLQYTLGVVDVSPLDMASAYGVFAARGQRQAPTPVVKVVDAQGRTLEDNRNRQPKQPISEVIADNVTAVLRTVITSGTGTGADIGRPAAGKTGTGENFTNAWFVGYTPTLSTSVWMGYADSQSKSLRNIRGVSRVFGGTIPASTWKAFMSVALKDVPVTDFNQPAPIKVIADALDRTARNGFDPGPQRRPTDQNGGPYEQPVTPPAIGPPETTTTTTGPTVSSPTTTPSGGGIFP